MPGVRCGGDVGDRWLVGVSFWCVSVRVPGQYSRSGPIMQHGGWSPCVVIHWHVQSSLSRQYVHLVEPGSATLVHCRGHVHLRHGHPSLHAQVLYSHGLQIVFGSSTMAMHNRPVFLHIQR